MQMGVEYLVESKKSSVSRKNDPIQIEPPKSTMTVDINQQRDRNILKGLTNLHYNPNDSEM